MKCKHSWLDSVSFNCEHAQALCEYCGLVAWQRGFTPKVRRYMDFDGNEITCKDCIRIIEKTGEGLDTIEKHNHYIVEIKQFDILPLAHKK